MADKPEHDTREKPSLPKVDKNERFSLYPLATYETLRALLRVELESDQDDAESLDD